MTELSSITNPLLKWPWRSLCWAEPLWPPGLYQAPSPCICLGMKFPTRELQDTFRPQLCIMVTLLVTVQGGGYLTSLASHLCLLPILWKPVLNEQQTLLLVCSNTHHTCTTHTHTHTPPAHTHLPIITPSVWCRAGFRFPLAGMSCPRRGSC
jgi:hypothetical protein